MGANPPSKKPLKIRGGGGLTSVQPPLPKFRGVATPPTPPLFGAPDRYHAKVVLGCDMRPTHMVCSTSSLFGQLEQLTSFSCFGCIDHLFITTKFQEQIPGLAISKIALSTFLMEKKRYTPDTLCSLSTHCSMPSGEYVRQKVWPQSEFETILVPREAAKK